MITMADIQILVREGEAEQLLDLIRQMLEADHAAEEIINEGLLPAMVAVGEDFKDREIFIPEVMIAARAMNAGLVLLRPLIAGKSVNKGTVIIGTVKGDCHDIGKNIVKIMLEGKGLKVVDLGVDVAAEQYIKAAREYNANIICCSALLTTTMGEMTRVVEQVKQEEMSCKVMIGGAVVSQAYCDSIGADCYTEDASSAADAAVVLCGAQAH